MAGLLHRHVTHPASSSANLTWHSSISGFPSSALVLTSLSCAASAAVHEKGQPRNNESPQFPKYPCTSATTRALPVGSVAGMKDPPRWRDCVAPCVCFPIIWTPGAYPQSPLINETKKLTHLLLLFFFFFFLGIKGEIFLVPGFVESFYYFRGVSVIKALPFLR